MVITPSTDIYLLKSPLEISDINQLTFSNATAQYNYFNSLPKIGVNDYSYQRKDGTIRYGGKFDDIIGYNYVMYRNDAYSNKWFYAYITGMEYLNDNVTAVSIKTDVYQTWMFDLEYKDVFVEREHVNDDTYGKHTIPESLETGPYIRGSEGLDYDFNGEYWLGFQVTELISNMSDGNTGGRIYNGVYNGLILVLVDNYVTADLLVSAYDDAGKADSIISCFYIPKRMESAPYTNSGVILHGESTTIYFPRARSTASNLGDLSISRPNTLDGYVPKNNKMFTKEFCYLYVTNNSGVDVTYAYEDWKNLSTGESATTADFRVDGTISQGCSIKLYPESNYKTPPTTPTGYTKQAYAEGINAGKLPLCSWNSDYYTNWVTQNSVNVGVGVASTLLSAGQQLFTGNVVGMAGTLLSGIGGAMSERHKADTVPNQAKGNTNAGDINFTVKKEFSLISMTIKREYAICCDNFLSVFGYKCNRVKRPNITGRRNWNYVKTIGCYIAGDVPQDDLNEIKAMFDKGVTFWHNPNTFMDYSQNNDII